MDGSYKKEKKITNKLDELDKKLKQHCTTTRSGFEALFKGKANPIVR
jgi:hypothetical protein